MDEQYTLDRIAKLGRDLTATVPRKDGVGFEADEMTQRDARSELSNIVDNPTDHNARTVGSAQATLDSVRHSIYTEDDGAKQSGCGCFAPTYAILFVGSCYAAAHYLGPLLP